MDFGISSNVEDKLFLRASEKKGLWGTDGVNKVFILKGFNRKIDMNLKFILPIARQCML